MIVPAALLAALTAAAGAAPERCRPDPPGATAAADAAFIRDAEQSWAASIAVDEAAFLRAHTADDFVAVFDGAVIPRAALIAEAEKRPPGAATNRMEDQRVHVSGSTAVAEGTEYWLDVAPKRRIRIVWSDLWVRCGGRWRLVTSTSIGTPAP